MLFDRLGYIATRFRIPIIAGWLAAAVLVTLLAPSIEEVASSDQADFLPSDAPFAHAEKVFRETFPESFAPGSTVIVIEARDAGPILNREADDFAAQIDTETGRFIAGLTAWLTGPDGPDTIKNVASPTNSPMAAALMVSDDNQIAIVSVDLHTSNPDIRTEATMEILDDWLAEHRPAGVHTYQTGTAPIVNNTSSSVKTSVDRTVWVTVLLVIVMLLAVYRSPVSPLVPLSAVTVAYLITRGIVAYLGDTTMTITSYANVLLVVVMYGAGTDYCLFLISRFREEMANHHHVEPATRTTVRMVGETITSSAGTIFVGFMAMAFAEMGIFNTTGPSLAIAVVMSLLAGLTFVPALLATLGDRAFWPGRATHRSRGRLYELTSKAVSTYPLAVILVIVTLMLPLSIYGMGQNPTYDLVADLPEDKPSVVGYDLMQESLGAGNAIPLSVILTGRDPEHIATDIAVLTEQIAALDRVQDVRGLNSPLGLSDERYYGLLRVDWQLRLALEMLGGLPTAESFDAAQLGLALDAMRDYLDLLAARFPEVADDPHLLALQDLLGNRLALATRQADVAAAVEGLAARFETVDDPYLMPTALSDVFSALPAAGGDFLAQLLPGNVAEENTAFKLTVVLADRATTDPATQTVRQIRTILEDYRGPGEAVASGGAAINTDIRDTMDRDLLRAIAFVLLGIFVVLTLMLRSLVAPVYLIGTVVLSFTFTLGLTNLVFKTLFDVQGLTWYVPFFQFVFLVALGIDYSIFLFGRVKEEVAYHGMREGVHVAVASTGAIITSAGMILSGTFAAMMSGEVMGLVEIGFAVAVGVLIDTFVVRTVLDPALATYFGRWTWWPGGVPRRPAGRDVTPQAASEPAD